MKRENLAEKGQKVALGQLVSDQIPIGIIITYIIDCICITNPIINYLTI